MQTIQWFESLANIISVNLDEWVSTDEESCKDESCETEITDEVEEKAAERLDQVKERHAIWIHEIHLIMGYFQRWIDAKNKPNAWNLQRSTLWQATGGLGKRKVDGQIKSELEVEQVSRGDMHVPESLEGNLKFTLS